ncbi:MAG: hypothetical protein RLZZ511_234, partial [Cyanobacteriota bacterium]
MYLSSAELAQQRSVLLKKYNKLTASAKQMLQIMAVQYEPIGKTLAMPMCNGVAQLDSDFVRYTDSKFSTQWKALIAQDLLIQDRGQGYLCNPVIIEVIMREVVATPQFSTIVAAVSKLRPLTQGYGRIIFRGLPQFICHLRWAIYQHDLPRAESYLHAFQINGPYNRQLAPNLEVFLNLICNEPFDGDWLDTCPHDMADRILVAGAAESKWELTANGPLFAYLENIVLDKVPECGVEVLIAGIEQFLLRNQFTDAVTCLSHIPASERNLYASHWGWLKVLQGDYAGAIVEFERSLQALRQKHKQRKLFFDGIEGVFYILALLQTGTAASFKVAEEYVGLMQKKPQHHLNALYRKFGYLLHVLQGNLAYRSALLNSVNETDTWLDEWIGCLCVLWVDAADLNNAMQADLIELYQAADLGEYHWVKAEVAELLSRFKRAKSDYAKTAAALRSQSQFTTIADIIQPTAAWELRLTALTNLNQAADSAIAPVKLSEMRLAWFIHQQGNGWTITPKEQKINAKGTWSKGRAVALKRLKHSRNEFDYLTPQDIQACEQIEVSYSHSYYGGNNDYSIDKSALLVLVGHPLVFWENAPETRIDIVKAEPELLVKKDAKRQQLLIQLSPQIRGDASQKVLIEKETLTRIRVVEVKENHRRIAQIIGDNNALEVPIAAQERVLAALGSISGLVTVHSDIGGGMTNVEEVPADAKPYVQLLPANDGLRATILVKPFAIGGSYFRAGKGGETVIAEIEGRRLQTSRNLKEEQQRYKALVKACPTLDDWPKEDEEWWIDEPESCLELLMELHELGDTISIEWPEGEKMRIKGRSDSSQWRVKVQQSRDWFEASGELTIGDDEVLNMQQLLALVDQAAGRFIPLGDGQFLALTETFRKQLDDLRGYSEKHGQGVRFHPLAALALEDTIAAAGDLTVDQHWRDHQKKLQAAQDYQPKLPSTLQAELRDYQQEGFEWLARLAHWGVGACLADDMGLGKTLQALSLILTRAPQGPTLVLAPLSVCMNWISEVAKFAPTLNVVQFGSADRQTTVDELAAFDLLVCSYGLLQQDDVAEMLAGVSWQTVVLDEAQAIKNMATKRSQAAMKLQAGFKLITTGTPIENHLGELWNLFRFINPGLLGSLEQFNARFARPIEQDQDDAARQRLRKLVQPFMLRRTKTQVLSELPSRTEILLQVELSKEEAAFYEALRQESIRNLSVSDAEAGAKHLQVLAEIMKLRRACCNPSLVQPKMQIPSSKLALFGETLTELLENKHKALVFSQFVDHLSILQSYLDEQKISYQYLDGSTPAKERKKRVDAFQAGEGDVFLISLKAGGTGLNLTAADYVIHMDPWWNPAVEDQASDRAHRIGQQRPVTIYR